ncbi:F-box/kelch-repeat protein At3g23880-like [Salvia miltiorrhiza]|uniref:F-box/kelch-repeat protein At3g23880-like n=1 Tax=Salvia miltiorrhiza TaxID=226208 RepID=UPI0025ABD6A8|nr:F-box/kelch-repeat protein At3g23880-like [Salvia miltiorrhiza]XP_057802356.1 F-box/kelch-repeat protein At3g23880-like [Salvia miltiorrhiza]XP_057802357.1 F-box/kelch-repeat protein At3g23880-like [Salvia miltiorrhiza]
MESENTPQLRNVKTHISHHSLCLPEEIIEEILQRLPVNSLLKFRCVSKSWRSLIDSRRFIQKHLDYSAENAQHGIILNSLGPDRGLKQCSLRSMLDDPFTNQFRVCDSLNIGKGSISVVGSCNGLVCILHELKHFILWNPSTRMSRKLPDLDHKSKRGHITSCGFGFDYLSGDYKVFGILSIFWVTARYEAISKVYSLETNSWKSVKIGGVPLFSEQGKFASGKLHWHRTVGLSSDIASFDLRSEAYGVVELPCYLRGGCVVSMEVIRGCLSILCDYPSGFNVWIMKQYGVRESWQKVATVPQLDNNPVPCLNTFPALLALGPKGEVVLTHGSTFVIYCPEDDGYRHFQVKNLAPFRDANVYVESLVSLTRCDEQEA